MADSNEPVSGNSPSSQQITGGNQASDSADDSKTATPLEVSLQQAIQKQASVSEVDKFIETQPRLLEAELLYEVSMLTGDIQSWKITPLAFAIMVQNEPVVEHLLKRSANVHAIVTENGFTMLHLAAQCRNQDEPQVSDQGVVVKSPDTPEKSQSFMVAKSRQERIIALLLDSGVDPRLRSKDGTTAFHFAALSGHLASMKLIFDKIGRECINYRNRFGLSPLHWACGNGHTEMAEWLIDQGAALEDTVHVKLSSLDQRVIMTPLCSACCSGHVKIADMLLKCGANPSPQGVTHPPILIACWQGNFEMFALLKIGGAGVGEIGSNGGNCYHWIAQSSSEDMTALSMLMSGLHSFGLAINNVNSDGETPLILACRLQKRAIVVLLLMHGANINARSTDGSTALIVASSNPDKSIVEGLVESGADISAINTRGQNAFSVACSSR